METEEMRRLLELAAKAAGIASDGLGNCYDMGRGAVWNPLEDDGDSRRLEVMLGMRVTVWPAGTDAAYGISHYAFVRNEDAGGCACAAARLAVLRVAAAVGDSQP